MAAKASLAILLLVLTVLSSLPARSSSQTSEKEKQILLRIKSSWGNPSALQSWTAVGSSSHCNWTGIQCSDDGSVIKISLVNENISYQIPDSICSLPSISYINLSYNNIPGGFPTSLYDCSKLQYLDISQNYFVGRIPDDIDRMPSGLTYLSLAANNFTGDIPPAIGRLQNLQSLLLDSNLFNGSFPAQLGDLPNLEVLTLAYNPFAPASIPKELGNLSKLKFLWIKQTNLIGQIPDSFGNLVELQHLDLVQNNLTGSIPPGIWKMKNLKYLFLYANKLSGEINGTIEALNLTIIDISINNLTGPIPEDFGKLEKLEGLALYYNNFTGEIPASIALLPALTDIRIFNNHLTGVLPPELGKHSKLANLEVSDNGISGELPADLCAGRSLKSVVLSNNYLTGNLPESLGACSTLDDIQIYNNRITGDFPAGIWSAVNLTTVIIHDNRLTGVLPEKLPWNLSRLDIANNQFSGTIPSSAGNLQVFEAANNQFSGEIPAGLAGSSSLQVLSLGGNDISGAIPPVIGSLKYLNVLDLSNNRLNGAIPASIGSLPALTSLDLSGNVLSGTIPPEIGKLKLNFLNLSSNQLSGQVPALLENRANDQSFLANPALCSPSPLLDLGPCGGKSDGRESTPVAIVLLVLFGALGLSAAAVFTFVVVRDYRRRMDGRDLASWKLISFRKLDFTEASIVRSLREENLIGSGGAGKVYKVSLGNRAGETVVVKKICNWKKLDSKLEKEFQAEVEILGLLRHANIVKLICCMSSARSKLLVYEYMENGSLDRWLHAKRRPEGLPVARGGSGGYGTLNWHNRLAIAIGAARGLCYMHHDCNPPVVHRDVKSSNILLDGEFGVKIADFGLARMLVTAGESESVSAVAGSFGYMAPECAYSRKVNEKVDVYSFGVVLLELITGREAHDGGEYGSLADLAWRRFQKGDNMMDDIDEEIRYTASLDEVQVVLKLGIICTAALPAARPTMKEVLHVLLRCDQAAAAGHEFSWNYEVAPLLQMKKGSRRKTLSDADQVEESFACNV